MIASLDALRPVLVTSAVGLALFCTVIAIAWPYLERDPLQSRMQLAVGSGERDRRRDKVVATTGKKRLLLGSEPSKLMAAIVARFNLAAKLEDGATVDMLKSVK